MQQNDNDYNQSLPSADPIWQQPEVIRWSQILTQSYQQLLGRKLIASSHDPEQEERPTDAIASKSLRDMFTVSL